ncbi:MAG: zinc-binding alcohol dehydrogenase family protein [Acidothermus sp.]|nr:zinc-binding alcohol dehydrogenase family protein [Acidothermus sp.]MCL6537731.1 zinc-binding alcohol dehydrogenase family protein [Acidothermus sp.]
MRTRAARLVRHGEPLVVQTVDLPEPTADDVVVDIAFAGVNPVDAYALAGRVYPDAPLPRTLGGEASGYLDGAPVLVYGEGLGVSRDGVYAEQVVAPRAAVFPLPSGIDPAEAACLGVVGTTAWRAVHMAEIGPQDRVLVLGGAGGVGLTAISYAASTGARVWGQTGDPQKVSAITEAGAERAVVTDAAGLEDAVRELAPTVVLDALGDGFTVGAIQALQPRGRIVLYGTSAGAQCDFPLQQLYRKHIRLLGYGGLIATREERREAVHGALTALAEGQLRIRVGAKVGLSEINEAFTLLRNRSVPGKIVVEVRG